MNNSINNPNLVSYRVMLYEEQGEKFQIAFDCHAEDPDHAYEQAKNAYPSCQVVSCTAFGDVQTDFVNGEETWHPALEGVRIAYKNVMIDGEYGRGEVHINATHEGLITDIWANGECEQPGSQTTDYNIGTESVLIQDIVSRLVEENA